MRYRPEIDGLRSIAVVPVVLFHAGLSLFSGGFVGVDVFFVISGYLITTIIMSDLQAGAFSVVKFYERRARRILPALMFTTALALPFAYLWLLPNDLVNFAHSLSAVYLFGSNVFFFLSTNYFDSNSEMKPLLHTWSLAVEEQYYLIFPLMMMALWHFGKRWITAVLIVSALFSLAASQWLVNSHPGAAFYLPLSRAWELLLGGLASFHIHIKHPNWRPGKKLSEAIAFLGLALIIFGVFAFDRNTPFPGIYALPPAIGAILIILFASPDNLAGRILGSKVPVGVGLISYSLYLIHQPVFAFALQRIPEGPSLSLMLVLAALCVPFAYLMWRFIEAPFRNSRKFSRRQIFQFSAIGCTVFIALGIAGGANQGYPQRLPAEANRNGLDMPLVSNGWCFYSVDSISSLEVGKNGLKCALGDKTAPTRALLFGDSFAGQYEPFWDKIGKSFGLQIDVATTNWCYPSGGDGFIYNRAGRAYAQCLFDRRHVMETLGDYDVLILSGAWAAVLEQGKMQDALDFIDYARTRVKRIILMPAPGQYDGNVLAAWRKSLWFSRPFDIARFPSGKDGEAVEANDILRQTAGGLANVFYVPRSALFDIQGVPPGMTDAGIPFSFDGSHISIFGSQRAADIFLHGPQSAELKSFLNIK